MRVAEIVLKKNVMKERTIKMELKEMQFGKVIEKMERIQNQPKLIKWKTERMKEKRIIEPKEI